MLALLIRLVRDTSILGTKISVGATNLMDLAAPEALERAYSERVHLRIAFDESYVCYKQQSCLVPFFV